MPLTCLDAPVAIVLITLDDMRFDQVAYLPESAARMNGLSFSRAYVTTPLCAPSRASLLSGGYTAAQTGVLGNGEPNGGAARFPDGRTLATRLQEHGYATGLVGKYLNGYEDVAPYVPPGWTEWAAWANPDAWSEYDLIEGSSTASASSMGTRVHHSRYFAEYQAEWAARFLHDHRSEPLFLYVSMLAPHNPHIPAESDTELYPGYTYRERGYQEGDVTDKPAWVQALPLWTTDEQALADAEDRERLQSLAAADRAIVSILDAITSEGLSEHTLVVVTSDNGQMWGEHRLADKGVAYEEASRVPLVFLHPGLSPTEDDRLVAMNLDLPATIQELAGLSLETAGVSFAPLLCGGETPRRESLLLENWSIEEPAWAGLVTPGEKYVEWVTGERELYDLINDPYELTSQHGDASVAVRIEALSDTLAATRGLDIVTRALPDATLGEPYEATLASWGGVGAITWASDGPLPSGLTLAGDGTISGIPTAGGDRHFPVAVEDEDTSPLTGAPQRVESLVTLRIVEKDGGCGCGTGTRGAGGVAAALAAALGRRRLSGAR